MPSAGRPAVNFAELHERRIPNRDTAAPARPARASVRQSCSRSRRRSSLRLPKSATAACRTCGHRLSALIPGQTCLAFFRGFLVDFVDDAFERLLQMRRIVDLEHQLPRQASAESGHQSRRRTRRPAAPRNRCEYSVRDPLQLVEILVEIGRNRVASTPSKSSTTALGFLTTKPATRFASGEMYSSEPIGPGWASHEVNAVIGFGVGKHGPRVRLAVGVFLIKHKRLHIQDAEFVQSLFVLIAASIRLQAGLVCAMIFSRSAATTRPAPSR